MDDELTTGLDPMSGYLSLMADQMQTSEEAKGYARRILEDTLSEDAYAPEQAILEKFRETAEDSRMALKQAREKLLARQYDPANLWLAAAQGFGAPTRTGAFGETLGNVAGLIREPVAQRQEFNINKEEQLLGLDQAITGVDQGLLENEFALAQLQKRLQGDLSQEALKVLGKGTRGSFKQPSGMAALDRNMGTIASEWISMGAADAAKSMAELNDAMQILDASDNISGPYVGLIPKGMRDWGWPDSSNVQELIETTAQRSMRAILGAQFTEREGMMILQRTFNPNLEESVNRRRAWRLFNLLAQAKQSKEDMIQFFLDNGTLQGYDGKISWTIEDFEPEPVMIEVTMPDGGKITVPDNWTKKQVAEEYAKSTRQAKFRGGRVRHRRPLKRSRRYAEGGQVNFDDLPDEEEESGPISFDDLPGEPGSAQRDLLMLLGATAGGGAVGTGIEEVGTRLYELASGLQRPPRGQQLVSAALDKSGVAPADVTARLKNSERLGVPEKPLDVSGRVARELGERSLMVSNGVGDAALEELTTRHEESRDRVARQVEKRFRTPEYFTTEDRLTEKLWTQAEPYYKEAYKHTIKTPSWWGEMYETSYGKKAIERALEFMENSGHSIGKENIAGMVERPTLEFMDQIKRAYDYEISRAMNSTMGGSNNKARILRQQKNRLVAYLDKNGPEAYQKARKQFKGDLEVKEALEAGRNEFHRMAVEEARRAIQDMSFAEKQAFKTGVAQKFYDIIYAPSTDVAAARRLIGSPEMRRKIELLFDKPREYRLFEAALQREMDLWEKGKKMISRAERGKGKKQMDAVLATDDPFYQVKKIIGSGPVMWFLKTFSPWKSHKHLSDKEADEVLRILNTGDWRDFQAREPQLEYAGRYAKKRKGRRGKAAAIGAAVGAALAAASAFGGEQEEEISPEELEQLLSEEDE